MRRRRGTELHGRWVFLLLVVVGVLAILVSIARMAIGPPDALRVVTSVVMTLLGVMWAWRGGYMLEWWGPPEPRDSPDR